MSKKLSVIESIYSADLIPSDEIERERADIKELEDEFFKDERIAPNSKLGIAISNFAADYSCICRGSGFKEGFRFGVLLMSEVYGIE